MSGGSWDYLYGRIGDAAARLKRSELPHRKAFGRLMEKVAEAMHMVEWVDSGDCGDGDEIPAILKALGKGAKALVLAEVVEQAMAVEKTLKLAIRDAVTDG